MAQTVSEVARLSGVSVRALHHYDELGLLRPSRRSEAGYRLYGEEDLQRLQQILFYRELGLPLEEIGRVLDDPAFDRRRALEEQRDLLVQKRARLEAMIRSVEAALGAASKGGAMGEAMFEGFDPGQFEDEAKQRWGETAQFHESQRRMRRYSRSDLEAVKREARELAERLAAAMAAGEAPGSQAAMDAAEAQRLHIERWFYPCPRRMHCALGELYASDPRFRAGYEGLRPGLAAYAREAIAANAARE